MRCEFPSVRDALCEAVQIFGGRGGGWQPRRSSTDELSKTFDFIVCCKTYFTGLFQDLRGVWWRKA